MDKRRKRIVAGLAVFMAFMWLCTLVSKSIYASKLPMVSTTRTESKYIEHIVEAEGIVEAGGETSGDSLKRSAGGGNLRCRPGIG